MTDPAIRELANQACAMLSVGTFRLNTLADRLGRAAYPAVSWPPPANATASHRAAYTGITNWITRMNADAVAMGHNLCEHLRALGIELIPAQVPTAEPTPGRLYRISTGDNLLNVTGRAYGVGSGGTRLRLSKVINNDPANRTGLRYRPASGAFEVREYPTGLISFGAPFQTLFVPIA